MVNEWIIWIAGGALCAAFILLYMSAVGDDEPPDIPSSMLE